MENNQEAQDAGGANEAQDHATSFPNYNPVALPNEVLSMIFTEAFSKPAVHYATAHYTTGNRSIDLVIRPWSSGDLESSYLTANVIRKTCQVGQDAVKLATKQPVVIEFDNGPKVTIDDATDLVCLVLPKRWALPLMRHPQPWPEDQNGRARKVGKASHVGLLVDREMWRSLLTTWFVPDPHLTWDATTYEWNDMRMDMKGLARIMAISVSMQTFDLVLTDVSEHDWNCYYKNFPTVLQDRNGSYVRVWETPIHRHVIKHLWYDNIMGLPGLPNYPYMNHVANLNLDPTFEDRVDGHLHPSERVALLLGNLGRAAELHLQQRRILAGDQRPIRIGLLARKPSAAGSQTTARGSCRCTAGSRTGVSLPSPASLTPLSPELPETDWIKQALDRIFIMSKFYWERTVRS